MAPDGSGMDSQATIPTTRDGHVVLKACTSCRLKHLKCNGVKPCTRCIAQNLECNFTISRRGYKGPRKAHLAPDSKDVLGQYIATTIFIA